MFVKPTPGRKVRHPGEARFLSEKGENVMDSFYWQRLKNNGDIVVMEIDNIQNKNIVKKGKENG